MSNKTYLAVRVVGMGYSQRIIERRDTLGIRLDIGGRLVRGGYVFKIITDGIVDDNEQTRDIHQVKITGASFVIYYRIDMYPNGKCGKKLLRIFVTYSASEKKVLEGLNEYEIID